MEWLKSTEIVATISFLLPGFVAAWVFHGLTAHPRREPFERVIHALIFTAFIQAATYLMRIGLECAASCLEYDFGPWTPAAGVVWSFVIALMLGTGFSALANYDVVHSGLRRLGITKRTSFPSEWFSAFNRDKRFVVLHLEDGRRLMGWPEEWPDSSEGGHFVICNGSWLLDDNQSITVHAVEHFLIPVGYVKFVERCKYEEEIKASQDQQELAERAMLDLQRKEQRNGQQSTGPVSAESGGQTSGRNNQAVNSTGSSANSSASAQKVRNRSRKKKRP